MTDRDVDRCPVLPRDETVLIGVQDAVVDHVDADLTRSERHLAAVVRLVVGRPVVFVGCTVVVVVDTVHGVLSRQRISIDV